MKKSLKQLLTLSLLVLSIFSLVGCSSKKETSKNPSIKEITDKVKETTDVSSMSVGDKNKLKKLYDIDPSEIEDFSLFTASSNVKADEIAIIKVKDSKNLDKIKENISKRVEKQGTSFKDYLPKEYYLIENHVLKTEGNYILLAISKDSEKIQNTFDGFF